VAIEQQFLKDMSGEYKKLLFLKSFRIFLLGGGAVRFTRSPAVSINSRLVPGEGPVVTAQRSHVLLTEHGRDHVLDDMMSDARGVLCAAECTRGSRVLLVVVLRYRAAAVSLHTRAGG